jgi:glyoxylase-like metal-dependent hydrolase (beta-lactamase superfamily II)
LVSKSSNYPYKIIKETLDDIGTDLTSLYFRHGGNFYVFSYQKDGIKKHTLVDAGDLRHRDVIESVLNENYIDIKNIERIIITHRHPDHCGFAYLFARESGAQILVHTHFRDFAEGRLSKDERSWLGSLDPTAFSQCDIRYLSPTKEAESIKINGIDFPRLLKPIKIGSSGEINILAVPANKISHTPDQIVVLYSTGQNPNKSATRPSDDIFFSGDLWLMHGPIFEKNMRSLKFYL